MILFHRQAKIIIPMIPMQYINPEKFTPFRVFIHLPVHLLRLGIICKIEINTVS